MKNMTNKELLDSPVCDLPGLSNRVRNCFPWSYSSEITIQGFFNWCVSDGGTRKIGGLKAPRIHGIGVKGLQKIRGALLKAGFTVKDSAFLQFPTK
jgi:hypothetical protein